MLDLPDFGPLYGTLTFRWKRFQKKVLCQSWENGFTDAQMDGKTDGQNWINRTLSQSRDVSQNHFFWWLLASSLNEGRTPDVLFILSMAGVLVPHSFSNISETSRSKHRIWIFNCTSIGKFVLDKDWQFRGFILFVIKEIVIKWVLNLAWSTLNLPARWWSKKEHAGHVIVHFLSQYRNHCKIWKSYFLFILKIWNIKLWNL